MERYGTFSETRAYKSVGLTLVTISPCLPGKRALCKLSLWIVYYPAAAGSAAQVQGPTREKRILFLREQSGDVYENKGPLWKSGRQAGMFMKTQVVMS
jgi:hypothetical protein